MASKERETVWGESARQPARVKLMGKTGEINVNIHKVTGNISVGNTNTVTHYHHKPRCTIIEGKQTSYKTGKWTDSDSSESDSSSSDSDSERFFASQGVAMPTKREWKEMARNMKQMAMKAKQMAGVKDGNRAHTVIVDENGTPSAFDKDGKRVPLQSQTVFMNGRTTSNSRGSAATNGRPNTNNTHATKGRSDRNAQGSATQQAGQGNYGSRPNSNPGAPVRRPENHGGQASWYQQGTAVDPPTTYEKQTQIFERIMTNLSNKTVDEAMVFRLSSNLSKGWRRVFRHLGISDADIDGAFQDCGQVQETVHNLLVRWTRGAHTPDVRTLVEALVRAEQLHVIQLLHP